MKTLRALNLLGFLCVFFLASAFAAEEKAVQGKFYVSVDDKADILVNGKVLHSAPLNESESPEVELKAGDRIVVKLKNTLGKGRLMLLFMSKDRATMIAFRKIHFRILPDPEIKDFTVTDFSGFRKQARSVEGDFGKPYLLPFQSNADWMWGDVNVCSIGCLVSPDLFKPNPRR